MNRFRKVWIATSVIGVAALATAQIGSIIKLVGVGAAVQKFGPDINKQINKLTGHTNTSTRWTKVVPILTVSVTGGRNNAIGAAQVIGPKVQVEKVKAVAQPMAKMFGNEITVRGLVPIEGSDPSKMDVVDGVGVSGIVDLRL